MGNNQLLAHPVNQANNSIGSSSTNNLESNSHSFSEQASLKSYEVASLHEDDCNWLFLTEFHYMIPGR